MSVSAAVQKAIRARLIESPSILAMVPAAHILDRNQRPAPDPSIILGEVQAVEDGQDKSRKRTRVYHTVHVWKKESSLAGVTAIGGEMRLALHFRRLELGPGFHAIDNFISSIRTMRDPDGETSHAVVTVETLAQEIET